MIRRWPGPRARPVATVVVAVALPAAALVLSFVGRDADPAAPSQASTTSVRAAAVTTVTAAEAVRLFRADRDYRPPAEPHVVEIPAIGVRSELQHVHRLPDGTLGVPDWHRAGWWAEGPKPGQLGPAIIVGHVDSVHGPDVFYRLDELRPGDEVTVTAVDGTVQRFVVERTEQFPKDQFPTDAVYAPSLDAGLRLITCGGSFDRASGHYRDNVIVFAAHVDDR